MENGKLCPDEDPSLAATLIAMPADLLHHIGRFAKLPGWTHQRNQLRQTTFASGRRFSETLSSAR